MSYGSLVYTPGIKNFCKQASQAGVTGMIIPDLPFDNDEGLTKECKKNGIENIPVAAPSMSQKRLAKLAHAGFTYIYAALRTGITGTNTTIDKSITTRNFWRVVNQNQSHRVPLLQKVFLLIHWKQYHHLP